MRVLCFQWLVDVGRKEEKGQNSSSATVQHFWAFSDCVFKGFVKKTLFFSVAQSLPDSVSCHCFTLLLAAAENEGGFLAAGEVHPESSGVASLCFGSHTENGAGVWVLGINQCLLWALQSEREGLPDSLSTVAVLSSTS